MYLQLLPLLFCTSWNNIFCIGYVHVSSGVLQSLTVNEGTKNQLASLGSEVLRFFMNVLCFGQKNDSWLSEAVIGDSHGENPLPRGAGKWSCQCWKETNVWSLGVFVFGRNRLTAFILTWLRRFVPKKVWWLMSVKCLNDCGILSSYRVVEIREGGKNEDFVFQSALNVKISLLS